MEFGKDTIEKIESLVRAADGIDVLIDQRHYSTRDLKPVLFEPKPAALKVVTLTGLVDYIKANRDGLQLEKCVILVESFDKVTLASELIGDKRERAYFITAMVDDGLKVYPFEKYMPVEGFVIALRSMFEPTPDLEKMITYVSKVRGGKAFSLEDDGVSQTASVQTSASGALTKKETAPAIVKLRPYRTFRDIDQIESEFLFRMKLIDTEENVVGCALFEADGGRWRNQATNAIRDFLKGSLPEGPAVIA
jgi:hypothetical protein